MLVSQSKNCLLPSMRNSFPYLFHLFLILVNNLKTYPILAPVILRGNCVVLFMLPCFACYASFV